jgi:hypothetical protein
VDCPFGLFALPLQGVSHFYELLLDDVIKCSNSQRLKRQIVCIREHIPPLAQKGMNNLTTPLPVPGTTTTAVAIGGDVADLPAANYQARPRYLVELFLTLQWQCDDWLKYDLDRDGRATSVEVETVYHSWLNALIDHHKRSRDATAAAAFTRVAECMRPMLPEAAVAATHDMCVPFADGDPVRGFTIRQFHASKEDWVIVYFERLRATCSTQAKRALWWSRYDLDKDGTITAAEVAAVYRAMLDFAERHATSKHYPAIARCVRAGIDRTARAAVRSLEANGQPGVQKDEFDRDPQRLTRAAEDLFTACEAADVRRHAADALFRYYDRNGDGAIERDEVDGFYRWLLSDARRRSDAPGYPDFAACVEQRIPAQTDDVMTAVDLDRSGRIERAEWPDADDPIAVGAQRLSSHCERFIVERLRASDHLTPDAQDLWDECVLEQRTAAADAQQRDRSREVHSCRAEGIVRIWQKWLTFAEDVAC